MPVDTQHPEYAASSVLWAKCRAANAGQEAVQGGSTRYLPALSDQKPGEYESYKFRALFYNATGRTVDGLSGMIFRRPPAIDLPAAIEYVEDDFDTAGTPLLAACEKIVEEVLITGRVGLLVDFPAVEGLSTVEEYQAAGARPYVQTYSAESIINWHTDRVNNQVALTLVVLEEKQQTPDPEDAFNRKVQVKWRVLRLLKGLYQVEVWRKENDKYITESVLYPEMNGARMDFIPFVLCGPMGVDVAVAKPPLLDLVNVNLSHYANTADYENGLHLIGVPTPMVFGYTFAPGETFALGGSEVRGFASPDTRAEFLEFKGEGLGALSKRLEEKEEQMATLGARMLAADKRTAGAADAAIHRSGENGVLSSLALAVGWAIGKALTWAAKWAGGDQEATVELNTDYMPTGMTALELTSLVAAWQSGAISYPTLFDNLQRGEIARQGSTVEEEQSAIQLQVIKPVIVDTGNGTQ